MRTSIIIPLFNQAHFVREAVESALAQTVPCEVIIVNDGSTDGGRFVADEYAERGVRVIHQVNKGLASARNTGIMNATGEFILPLDADDKLLPTAVERMEKVFDEIKDADIVAPSFSMFGASEGDVILMMRPTAQDFRGGNRIGYCSMFRRKDALAVGGYSPKMVWGYEDLHLWINLLSLGKKIYTIPEPLWMYRRTPGSMIDSAQQHHNELMGQIAKDFNFYA